MTVKQLPIENVVDGRDIFRSAQNLKSKMPGESLNGSILRVIQIHRDQLQALRCPVGMESLEHFQVLPRILRLGSPEVQQGRLAARRRERLNLSRQIGERTIWGCNRWKMMGYITPPERYLVKMLLA